MKDAAEGDGAHRMPDATPNPVIRADAATKLALDRTRLAHERTLLAWVRTSTALITFGFSIQQFFRIARQGTPQADRIGPIVFGFAMVVIGLVALFLATLEHLSATRDLNLQYPVDAGFPAAPRSEARVLAALIALLGILALLGMFIRG